MSKLFDQALTQVPNDIKRFIDNSFDIANEIHSILERKGKTQKDLANMLGKSESEISKWLTGSHNFTLKSVSKIESVLNEKIITTPLRSQQDFIALAAKASEIFRSRLRDYSPVVKKELHPVFVEISNTRAKVEGRKRERDIVIERQSYAMVA
ncbi:MAG: helix-turn-helix transcriptional regulator [Chryseolinea sp.]